MSRKPPVSQSQWLMARRLNEGSAPPERSKLAVLLGVSKSAVSTRATAEGWRPMNFVKPEARAAYRRAIGIAAGVEDGSGSEEEGRDGESALGDGATAMTGPPDARSDDETPPDFPAHAGAFVSRQLARLIARADRNGGRLDKAQIDGLVSLSRIAGRWEAGAMERAKQEIRKSDDELAATLARIDERIVELARAYAEWLVEAERAGGAG